MHVRAEHSLEVVDLAAEYRADQVEIDRVVLQTVASGWYLNGEQTAAFEREFAVYCGVSHALGTGSGTDALVLALRAAGIGPGDTVITVSHTAVATVAAIEIAGATPLLVDIDRRTLTMAPDQMAEALSAPEGRTARAVIPVHLYGQPADMPAITALAHIHGLAVIADCAQAHGAKVGGRGVAELCDAAAFSFYPTKNLGAMGDAGALVTNDSAAAERAAMIKQYGWRERYISEAPGMNSRLDEIQAAILRVKLRRLDENNARRRRTAEIYNRELAGCGIELPATTDGSSHVYHQYVVRTDKRDSLRKWLAAHGVGSAVLYPEPVHLQPAYHGRVVVGPGGLPQSEAACRKLLCLPVHPGLSDDDAHRVSRLVRQWAGANGLGG